jgi:hypothetical protein
MITPSDTPSAPAQFDAVTPHGQGTAPYDVQAPMADLAAMTESAVSLTSPGGPRQSQAETLLSGSDGPSVTAGYSGGGGEDWPGDPRPAGA